MSFRVLRSLCQQLFAANIDVDLFRCWLADKAERNNVRSNMESSLREANQKLLY